MISDKIIVNIFKNIGKIILPNDQYNLLSKSIGLKGSKAKEFIEKNKN
jgi:hypothetical protein